MFSRLIFASMVLLPLTLGPATAAGQAPDPAEGVKARPNKQEIVDLMSKSRGMPLEQQHSLVDAILQNASAGQTPRSDFMLCTGLAHLGHPKAQMCVGRAYENGWGVVEDLSEAYAWYAIAHENASGDARAQKEALSGRDRVKDKLLSNYPAPNDDELEDLVNAQKSRIEQFREAVKK